MGGRTPIRLSGDGYGGQGKPAASRLVTRYVDKYGAEAPEPPVFTRCAFFEETPEIALGVIDREVGAFNAGHPLAIFGEDPGLGGDAVEPLPGGRLVEVSELGDRHQDGRFLSGREVRGPTFRVSDGGVRRH